MSYVRTMTTDQLRNDLEVTARQWPDGIPPEQEDRLRAIRGELKRRGADAVTAPAADAPREQMTMLQDMNDEGLQRELKRMSERVGRDPRDEVAQERFADVRFEIRRRGKNGNGETVSRLVPRQIEFDAEPEVKKPVAAPAPDLGQSLSTKELLAESRTRDAQNGALIAHIERQQLKAQMAHAAAQATAKILSGVLTSPSDIVEVDGDSIQAACMIGVKVAQTVYAKIGLVEPES